MNKTGLPKYWISALFKKFDARYPHKWASGIEGNEKIAVEEWSQVLAGLTGEDIKRGLENWKGDWPPSAEEFRKACIGEAVNSFELNYTPQYHHSCYRAIKDRSRLLSNDDRDKKREEYHKGLITVREELKSSKGKVKQKKAEIKKVTISDMEEKDFKTMSLLVRLKNDYPIARRLMIIRGYV